MRSSGSKKQRFFWTLPTGILSTASRGTLATDLEIFSQTSVGTKLEQTTSNRLRTKKSFLAQKGTFAAVLSFKQLLASSCTSRPSGERGPGAAGLLLRVCGPSRQLALDSRKLRGHPTVTTARRQSQLAGPRGDV